MVHVKFRHVYQGQDSNLCGHACLASILGISLKEAINRIGHTKGTTTKEMVRALGIEGRHLGGKWTVPSLLSVKWGNRISKGIAWHWVLYEGDVVMDPSINYKVDFDIWHNFIKKSGGIITSYLDLSRYYR